jgi:tRNA A37 threonylcarbamoyladenosine synthetase subunit TsaC/SUA5/YrdC
MKYVWVTIDAERALYVDRGVETILCDRLPGPVTLVLKVRADAIMEFVTPRHAQSFESIREDEA